ncbi:GldM family protein [uncultured Dokdonia sp.]|uniref:GldM family protein n=1 Tax=uncultured Dokdonia sp. TaxID=575653 RepID=UPI002621B746|nr:GldM family protein [uncultured Dokdonia sp.]
MNLKKIVVLLLVICFTVTSSYAQSTKKKSSDPSITVSKEALANFVINEDGDKATTNFKIKFPGYPTILVKGNTLNDEALARLKSSKKGTQIQVFDIKDASSKEKGAKRNPPLLFRLTTTP